MLATQCEASEVLSVAARLIPTFMNVTLEYVLRSNIGHPRGFLSFCARQSLKLPCRAWVASLLVWALQMCACLSTV